MSEHRGVEPAAAEHSQHIHQHHQHNHPHNAQQPNHSSGGTAHPNGTGADGTEYGGLADDAGDGGCIGTIGNNDDGDDDDRNVDGVSLSASAATAAGTRNCCVTSSLQLLLSTPGLVLLVVSYSLLGALIFPALEAPPAEPQPTAAVVTSSREECLKELWTITGKCGIVRYMAYLSCI